MKLTSVNVVHFRNILDSGKVAIESDTTCLVGKNESGKTSFLQALHLLNPAVTKGLNLNDYPAWLSKSHKLQGRTLENELPIRAVFELDDNDRRAAAEAFGDAVSGMTAVTVSRDYGGTMRIGTTFDEQVWVDAYVSEHCKEVIPAGMKPVTAIELAEALQVVAQEAPEEGAVDTRPQATQARAALQQASGDDFDVEAKLRGWVKARLPKFLYVGRYYTLPGIIDIEKIDGAEYDQLEDNDQIAKALLEVSSSEVDIATGTDYEKRRRELNDTANALTLEILEYWTQNTKLRVTIDFNQKKRGDNVIVKDLHVRLYDEEHMIDLPFGERSSGFQWFFSFLCSFSRYRLSGEPIILLLDEPALGLHARAQRDFLRYIEEKLAPRCQVIYSTHSPFLVEPKRLERIRLVEDKGRKDGSKVSADIMTTDADTLFPLQGALGYDLAQSLFVGAHNLIVEGTSDFTYLQLASDHLKAEGRVGLDDRCTIVPVGGAGQIATFAALLGSHVDATVLIDSMKQGNQRLDTLVKQGSLKGSRVIGIGEITETKEADIEDLFTLAEYLNLFNEAFGTKYKAVDLTGDDPIVRRLARAQKVDRYDHGRPAQVLLRKPTTFLGKLSKGTIDRFEKLFVRINGTFPK